MLKVVMIALAVITLSGGMGAGLASCRNAAETAAAHTAGTGAWETTAEVGDAGPVAPQAGAETTGGAHAEATEAQIERLWAALERETAARRAAERRLERWSQRNDTPAPRRVQPAARLAPVIPAAARRPGVPEALPGVAVQQDRSGGSPATPARAAERAAAILPAGTRIAVRTTGTTTSADARVEDRVAATTTSDVIVNGMTVIPAGTEVLGSVTAVERGGRMSGSDRITVRFHAVVRNGVETSLETAAISRSGPGQGRQNATRIGGGAAAGAVLGSIFGGRTGAAIGTAIGAAGGTGAAAVQRARPAVLERGATLTLQTTRATTIETS